jgi:hypothetical protein
MKAELVARNKDGEVRAWVSFDDEPWTVTELLEILQDWAETDAGRIVSIESASLVTPPPITTRKE